MTLLHTATFVTLISLLPACSGGDSPTAPAQGGRGATSGGSGSGGNAIGGSGSSGTGMGGGGMEIGGTVQGSSALGGGRTSSAGGGGRTSSAGGAGIATGSAAVGGKATSAGGTGIATGGGAMGGGRTSSAGGAGIATGGAAVGGKATSAGGTGIATGGAAVGGKAAQGGTASSGNSQGATAGASSGTTTIHYTVDASTIFPNPERGFYHHEETHANGHSALNASRLTGYRTNEAITLVLRLYYLESFRNSDISAEFLGAIAADLAAVRVAGLKAILRFAYTDSMTAPYGDASRARVLGHIAQLAPLFQQNADVILTTQAGFIGAWGEWYYTDHFGDQGNITATQWEDRRAVVDALLAALPHPRTVQLRTPAFKRRFFGTAALVSSEAFTTAGKARVAHHNDCFLSSSDDQGTYDDVTADKAYLAAENLYLPQGGETCAVSAHSDWAHAASDLASLHYTFLNRDYHATVLGNWGSNLDVARRLLGYRLTLTSGTYAKSAPPGGTLSMSLSLRNDGYAPPMGPRSFEVLLRHETTNALYRAPLAVDARRFVPGSVQTVDGVLCLPTSLASGNYRLWLALADPAPALRTRAEYAIRLANTQLWDASTGQHDLQHRVSIAGDVVSANCPIGGVPLAPE